MHRGLLSVLFVLSIALAGCGDSGGSDEVEDIREGFEDQQTSTEKGTIEVSLTTDKGVGAAPLRVTFTVSGTATDADGEPASPAFTWAIFSEDKSLGFEESGSALPGTASFLFETTGNHTVIAGVSADGFNDGFAEVTVRVLTEEELAGMTPVDLKLYYRADQLLPVPTPLPSGSAMEGTLSFEPGTAPIAALTGGPLQSNLPIETVQFVSDPLATDLTLLPDTKNAENEIDGGSYAAAKHAGLHTCLAGNANGVFSAQIYEVSGGTDTLVLENPGLSWATAALSPTGACAEHPMAFAAGMEGHTFPAGSQIKVVVHPDAFLGSVATEILFNGDAEPYDSHFWMKALYAG